MFYDRIQKQCKSKGISVAELLRRAGYSSGVSTQWKRGVLPSAAKLSEIAAILGVTTDYLLGTDTYNPSPKGDKNVNEEDIKFALFGGEEGITDEMYDEVKRFAKYISEKYGDK